MAGWPGCWAGLGRTEGQGAEFWLTRGGAVVVARGGGEGEARKLLVSCSFNCLDWTCGQPSGEDRLPGDN